MTRSNRMTPYEAKVIELAEAYEHSHLLGTGDSEKRLCAMRSFIRDEKREVRREKAKEAMHVDR